MLTVISIFAVLFLLIVVSAFCFVCVSGDCSREEEKLEQYYNDDIGNI